MKSFFKNVLATTLGTLLATLIALILIPLFFALVFRGMQGAVEPIGENSLLHLHIKGRLVERHRPLGFDFGSSNFFREDHDVGLFEAVRALELAKVDKRIQGVFLEMRQVEGGWSSFESLRRALQDFSDSGKFVYSYADSYSESSYFLATSASRVFLQPAGDIEFNGFALTEAFLKGLLEKLELKPRIFRVGKFKAAIEPFILDHMSPESREQNQTLLDDLWLQVQTQVSKATKQTPEQIDQITESLKLDSATRAQELGFVKEVAFLDQVEDALKVLTVGAGEDLKLVTPVHYLRESKLRGLTSRAGGKIAVLFAEGEIVSGTSSPNRIGSDSFIEDLREAVQEEGVQAIVIRVNSPGGDALASDVIWREITKADETKPVVISMGDVAASGGYYMAAGGRYIFAEPMTITGSIGVFGLLFGAEDFFKKKLGVNFDRVATHPSSDIGNPMRPMTSKEEKFIQESVVRVYSRFLEVVQESRGFKSREAVESLAEGRVWSGVRAQQLGLVDELGGLSQAIKKATELAEIKDGVELDVYPKEKDPFNQLLDRVSESVMAQLMGQGFDKIQALTKPVRELKTGVFARMLTDIKIQ